MRITLDARSKVLMLIMLLVVFRCECNCLLSFVISTILLRSTKVVCSVMMYKHMLNFVRSMRKQVIYKYYHGFANRVDQDQYVHFQCYFWWGLWTFASTFKRSSTYYFILTLFSNLFAAPKSMMLSYTHYTSILIAFLTS